NEHDHDDVTPDHDHDAPGVHRSRTSHCAGRRVGHTNTRRLSPQPTLSLLTRVTAHRARNRKPTTCTTRHWHEPTGPVEVVWRTGPSAPRHILVPLHQVLGRYERGQRVQTVEVVCAPMLRIVYRDVPIHGSLTRLAERFVL